MTTTQMKMKRWLIGCVCYLLLPPGAAAKCHVGFFASVLCMGKDTLRNAGAPWEQPDYFFPLDRPDPIRWSVTRAEEPQRFHFPEFRLGYGPKVSYRHHEVTLTQEGWHLSFRGFSKIWLSYHSTF